MIELQDYDIQLIEREIYLKYDLTPCDYADCDCLLSLRKAMINERVRGIAGDVRQGTSYLEQHQRKQDLRRLHGTDGKVLPRLRLSGITSHSG